MHLSYEEEETLKALAAAIRANDNLNLVCPSACLDYCKLDYRVFAESVGNLRRLQCLEFVGTMHALKLFLTRKGAAKLKLLEDAKHEAS